LENYTLYKKYLEASPFPTGSQMIFVDFSDTWDDKLKPLFNKAFFKVGLGTSEDNGGHRYMVLIDSPILEALAAESVWMGFRVTSWKPGETEDKPTTPYLKDKKKK